MFVVQFFFVILCMAKKNLTEKPEKKGKSNASPLDNPKSLYRYRLIDECVCRGNMNFQQICDYVNDNLDAENFECVTGRTVHDDIKSMRRLGAPIKNQRGTETKDPDAKEHGNVGVYLYTDPEYRFYKSQLSVADFEKLRSAMSMLNKYRGLSDTTWLEDVITQLDFRFGLTPKSENVVSFDQNEKLKGIEHLAPLIDYARGHKAIKLTYRTYDGRQITATIHPYHLKQYNGRWFLFGLDNEYQTLSNFPLDRIESFKPVDILFKENTSYDFATYFNNVLGVTIPKQSVDPETIRLRFSPHRFPYVVTKPIHVSQTVVDEEKCEIQIKVFANNELFSKLLAFGPEMEIISPDSIREQFRQKVEEMNKLYNP